MGDGLFRKLIKYYITWCIKVSRNLRDFINLCLWSLILFQVTFSSDLFFWRLAEINMNVEMKFVWRRDWWHIVFERFCNPLCINKQKRRNKNFSIKISSQFDIKDRNNTTKTLNAKRNSNNHDKKCDKTSNELRLEPLHEISQKPKRI